MTKPIIILYGSPGSGKGTQANLLADRFHMLHFDTGRMLESVVHDPKLNKKGAVKREKELFDSGKLLTPSWVLKVVEERVQEIYKARWGIVFSGSPRTIYEAERLMPFLSRLYGKKMIYVFILKVPPSESLSRNSARLICSVCGHPLLIAFYPSKSPKMCPICGGPFYKRTLDNPNTIKIRLKEYHERTEPIFRMMRKNGYRVIEISAMRPPYKIFKAITGYLNRQKNS